MEDLTKQQLILLALLVSFVTSIATGIVTVALMDQAPKAVTQTINRVVERTVEKLVPTPNQAAVVTKETIVVKEDDLVVKAIEQNAPNIVRIKRIQGTGADARAIFGAIGFVFSKDGYIVSDRSAINQHYDEAGNPIMETYEAVLANGSSVPLNILGSDTASGVAVFAPIIDKTSTSTKQTFTPAILGDSDGLKLGQAVVSLGGENDNSVSTGIISNLGQSAADNSAATTTAKSAPKISSITADVQPASLGAFLTNLDGDIVGIRQAVDSGEKNVYLPSNVIVSGAAKIIADVQARKTKTNF